VRVLADPTPDRLRRYNRWTAADLDRTRETLLSRGLLVEGRFDGTPRTRFAPGAVVPLAGAPPLEASKLASYGLVPDARGRVVPPLGVALPLRPLGEMFGEGVLGPPA